MGDLIERLTVSHKQEAEETTSQVTRFNLIVKASVPDRLHPGKRIEESHAEVVDTEMDISSLIKQFKKDAPQLAKCDLLLKCNNRLYSEGKVRQLGLTAMSEIELISLETEQAVTKNEGILLTFWSLVPLMISVSLIVAGLGGLFDSRIRGAYVLLGTIIGIPAFMTLVVGVTEMFTETAQVSYTGDSWFGPCDCKCCEDSCLSQSKREDEDEIDLFKFFAEAEEEERAKESQMADLIL